MVQATDYVLSVLGAALDEAAYQQLKYEDFRRPTAAIAFAGALDLSAGVSRDLFNSLCIDLVRRSFAVCDRAFADAKLPVQIAGREKTLYSIYRKMRDGKPWHLRGVDVFTVRDAIYARLPAFEDGLPSSVRLERGFDQSANVDRRLSRLQFDFTIAITLAGAIGYYQTYYRNAAAFCTASTFNLTNGLQVTWGA